MASKYALIRVDDRFNITHLNDAACLMMKCGRQVVIGTPVMETLNGGLNNTDEPVMIMVEPSEKKKTKSNLIGKWRDAAKMLVRSPLLPPADFYDESEMPVVSRGHLSLVFNSYNWFYSNYSDEDVMVASNNDRDRDRIAKTLEGMILKKRKRELDRKDSIASFLTEETSKSKGSSTVVEEDGGRPLTVIGETPANLVALAGSGSTYGLILLDVEGINDIRSYIKRLREHLKVRGCIALMDKYKSINDSDYQDTVSLMEANALLSKTDKRGFYVNICKILEGVCKR